MDTSAPMPMRTKIASIIRKEILSGEIKAGQELSLTETAQQLGVSRTPVREAFQTLESDGLITLRMNKGAVVNSIDEKFISDHYELRMLLEGEAAFRAAQRGMDTQSLLTGCEKMRLQLLHGITDGYVEQNQNLHTAIWQAADNRKLYAALVNLWNGPSIGRGARSADHHYLSTIEHREILEYISHGDGERARKAMVRHIERSMDNILFSYRIDAQEKAHE